MSPPIVFPPSQFASAFHYLFPTEILLFTFSPCFYFFSSFLQSFPTVSSYISKPSYYLLGHRSLVRYRSPLALEPPFSQMGNPQAPGQTRCIETPGSKVRVFALRRSSSRDYFAKFENCSDCYYKKLSTYVN